MATKRYENGLTVTVINDPGFRSVTVGIMVGAGSAYETKDLNGISHFIEHMLFKGTATRSAEDIVFAFDEAGASFNAFTGKEYTCFYFKSIADKAEGCFEVLSDIYLHPAFDPTELERERKVVLEEINMSFDEPDSVCYDLLYRHIFKGSVGMEIIGSRENVSRFTAEQLRAYKAEHYVPSNTVIAFVGNITDEQACSLVEKYMADYLSAPAGVAPDYAVSPFNGGFASYIHDYEQSEVSIAFPSFALSDARATSVSALDCVLGTSMSSRLFQRIREKMGLCYSVYSTVWMGKHAGLFSVCANVNSVNAAKCVDAIRDEIDKLCKGGMTAAELEKAKTQLKVNVLFNSENTVSRTMAILRYRVLLGEDYNIDETVRRIDALNVDAVNGVAAEILSSPSALAYVGKTTAQSVEKAYFKE